MEITLELDNEVYERLEQRADRHGFESPEEYGAVMINTVLNELETDEDEEVRNRLEDLGYL